MYKIFKLMKLTTVALTLALFSTINAIKLKQNVPGAHYSKKKDTYDPKVEAEITDFNKGVIGVDNRISMPNENDM